MTKASLLSRMKTKLGTAPTTQGQTIQDDVLGKIAEAIIEEIQQNGRVSVPATGLTAPNGAVTGSATGTIS